MNDSKNKYVRKDIHDLQINELNRRIDDLRSDLSHKAQSQGNNNALIACLFAGMQLSIALFLYIISR